MSKSKSTDETAAVLEKIAKMKGAFRSLGERLHALILETDPALQPRVWYGMPDYAKSKSSPVVCYFRADRESTFRL